VDVSQSVHELIPVIVSRFALPHGYEYSLQVATVRQACEDSDEGQLRRSNGDPTDGNHTHTHTQSSSSPLSTSSSFRWLSETANLSAQGVYLSRDFSAKLILRKKFWLNDSFLRTSNPYELHFAYLEVRQQVVDGTHPVSLEEAIEFASLHTQITYRNYDPLLHTTGFLRLAEILPPQHRGIGFIEEHIYKLHRQLKDMPEEKAKALYLRRAMKYGTFGVSFVQCREHTTSGHSNTGMFIGVDSNSVVILHGDNKDAVSVYNLHEVNQEVS
jgi:talin